MRHKKSEESAKKAAEFLRRMLGIGADIPVGIVLGTGWGDTIARDMYHERSVRFEEIPGFAALDPLEGHAREVVYGQLQDPNGGFTPVIALRGRVHLNERPADPALYAMARLQIEMLLQLGVKTLILTCAAGSLRSEIEVGSVVLIDGFVTLFAPDMPLFAGEFCSPEDTIDLELMEYVRQIKSPLTFRRGGHVMLRGPFFEGRRYDKRILAGLYGTDTQPATVGMSVLPEACIAALYEGVWTVPVAFVTNTASEEHSHEENQKRAKAQAEHLGDLLLKIVSMARATQED